MRALISRMGRYDTALKRILQRWGSSVWQQLANDGVARWCSPELPKVSTQYADLLAETASGQLWHLELQSTNDSLMRFRMLDYASAVRWAHDRFPAQCVLYVGREPLRMEATIEDRNLWFRYRVVDVRDLDGESLLAGGDVGDNIVAILTRLRNSEDAVRSVLKAIARLDEPDRLEAFEALLIVASLRELEVKIEQEARMMPVFDDILENKVLGREFKRGLEEGVKQGREEGREEGLHDGELKIIRRQVASRFGQAPPAVDQRLAQLTPAELEDLSVRVLRADSVDELM